LQLRARQLVKNWLTPYLKEKGFTKNGRLYSRHAGRMLHLIDIQQSPYNRADEVSFALNCGVHVPGVKSHFWNAPEPTKLDAADGIIDTRPGLVTVPKCPQWWHLRTSDGPEIDSAIGTNMRLVVEDGAFRRFFDRFQRENDVAEFLSQPRKNEDRQIMPANDNLKLVYAGIIWDQLGEYEKCKKCMAHAAELAKGKRLEADIEKFARNYVCGKLPRIAQS